MNVGWFYADVYCGCCGTLEAKNHLQRGDIVTIRAFAIAYFDNLVFFILILTYVILFLKKKKEGIFMMFLILD